jgi:hypothetical protein
MNTPTHDHIANQAYQLWQERGSPVGHDVAIWLEAERQLSGNSPRAGDRLPPTAAERAPAEMAAESVVEYQISPAVPEQVAIQAALQKQDARAPQVPHHTAPKGKPAETGKPLWTGPHSR